MTLKNANCKQLAFIFSLIIASTSLMYAPISIDNLDINIAQVSAESSDIEINSTKFPDEIFREYISTNFDTDGDGFLSYSEISNTTEIFVDGMGISDLTGIEYFTALTVLHCYENNLTKYPPNNPAYCEIT